MAAAMVPLIAIIGSGLDLSRAYLAKAKLQTACDAAALATRRHMANAVQLTEASRVEGRKFFQFNFPPGILDIPTVTPTIQQDATDLSVVEVSANAEVPTTLLRLFGKTSVQVSATCSADQDFVNNDIMLVLDVTASMNCAAGTNCSYAASEQSGSRLSRLRNAAAALYRALQGASGVRTRYGFMPYSMTVNVGRDLNTDWIRKPSTYHACRTYNNNNTSSYCTTWNTNTSVTQSATWFSNTWTGCLEERSSVGEAAWPIRINSTVSQADIDSTGTGALQWQPYDPGTTTGEYNGIDNLETFCPSEAERLATYGTEAAFQTQLNTSLARVGGYTNHDLGITWGMRYLSGTGMFSADNPDTLPDGAGNQIRVDRHIVFLTDGEMTADSRNYSAFGIPTAGDRLAGSSDIVSKHKTRFLAACNRARQMGATIWVIALDVGATGDISPCASGSDHFFVSNGTDLDGIFTTIGRGIGKLRVVK
jgi:hypothetical protein